MADIVLVHGTFTGGWIWGPTAKRLVQRGHTVHVPTLAGCGYRSHHLHIDLNFSCHVQDVSQLLYYENLEGAILAGHGYGGMVAATVAHRLMAKAAGMIHIDGVLPARGRSFADLAGKRTRQTLEASEHLGWLLSPPSVESFGPMDQGLRNWVSLRLEPFPRLALTQPNPYGAKVTDLPCAYVHCRKQADDVTRKMAAQAGLLGMKRLDLDSGPAVMLTDPDLLAATLDALASHMVGASGVERACDKNDLHGLNVDEATG